MSRFGAVIFFVLMLVVTLGIISFSSEFFLGRPLIDVLRDFLFTIYHKQ
jgi:hypothetical protein